MRITVAVWTPKGGVGKTSITLNLAHALRERRQAVTAFDLDPQGSLTLSVGDRSDLFPVRAVTPGRIARELPADGWALIDCPPGVTPAALEALQVADLFLAPVSPSFHALAGVADLVDRARALPHPPGLLLLLNMMDGRELASQAVEMELRAAYPRHVLKTVIPRAAAVERSHPLRKTVLEAFPGSPAAEAFRELAGEVMRRGKA